MPRKPTISDFFENTLGARLKNPRWSWGAINSSASDVFFRVWEDEKKTFNDRDCVLLLRPGWKGAGINERRKHLQAFQGGVQGFAVLCTAMDTKGSSRKIRSFDSTKLAILDKIFDVGELTYAEIAEYVAVEEIVQTTAGASGAKWTRVELDACVGAYLEMLAAELNGEAYLKSAFNEQLRHGRLSNRTEGSIEYRMRNISAVLEEFGLSRIEGYLPAGNVGSGSRSEIARILAIQGHIDATDYEETDDEEQLQRRTTSLRAKGFKSPPKGNRQPPTTTNSGVAYLRSAAVRGWVLEAADGVCDLCRDNAPFIDSNDRPFLEVHHVVPLADEGSDTTDNAVALCPNCHRKCHHAKDSLEASDLLYRRVGRLVR